MSFFFKKWDEIQIWVNDFKYRWFYSSEKIEIQNPICRILCVDDDPSFTLFMKKIAGSMSIQLDIASKFKEAKEKIEEHFDDYYGYIIDGYLPDGSGFELVSWIREKYGFNVPIGFISHIFQDASSFRLLKESLKVNYVLDKPMSPSDVRQLLSQLCQLSAATKKIDEPFPQELMDDLKKSYQAAIIDKIERLEFLILNVQKKTNLQNLQALKMEVHQIAGSAGSYGYKSVSELCKELELDLMKQIEFTKEGKVDYQWPATLDHFFTKIKILFQQ